MKKTVSRFTGVRVIHKAVDVIERLGAAGGGLTLAGRYVAAPVFGPGRTVVATCKAISAAIGGEA